MGTYNRQYNGQILPTPLSIDAGGTGAASAADARTALGLGAAAVEGVPLAVNKGGTGAATAYAACKNLAAAYIKQSLNETLVTSFADPTTATYTVPFAASELASGDVVEILFNVLNLGSTKSAALEMTVGGDAAITATVPVSNAVIGESRIWKITLSGTEQCAQAVRGVVSTGTVVGGVAISAATLPAGFNFTFKVSVDAGAGDGDIQTSLTVLVYRR